LVSTLPTAWTKPYLTEAPYLIIVFKRKFDTSAAGEKVRVPHTTKIIRRTWTDLVVSSD
jgi:hypothetical protein